jgi:ABC-type multidrug transport system fused ATPase/permease subunit
LRDERLDRSHDFTNKSGVVHSEVMLPDLRDLNLGASFCRSSFSLSIRGNLMELFQVEITGFKKFKDKATLKTRGKVLAILGANEAGKSSLLKALQRLDDNRPFQPNEISRGADGVDYR